MRFLTNLSSDLRYALRTLRSSPGFAAPAIVAIAVGVGINTGLFSVLNGLALRDMPAPDADQLVTIHQIFDGVSGRNVHGTHTMFSAAEYRLYRDEARTLEGIMAYTLPETVTLGGDAPQEIQGSLVTCNYFDVLRHPPALGRSFARDGCESPSGIPEIVLGHNLWTAVFAADPAVVGRTVLLNRNAFVVAGVAPEGFAGVEFLKASFFVPISAQPLLRPDRNWFNEPQTSWLTLVGRRSSGVDLGQIRAELGVIAARIDSEQPGRRTRLQIDRASPLSFPEVRPLAFGAAGVVMAGFGLVLLIACANVANLLLARAAARGREIALRLSLGATRARLVQQLLTESLLIAVAGGTLGAVLAFWSFETIVAFVLSSLPAAVPMLQIDPRPDVLVLAYAFAITLATGILFGLVPAIHASNPGLYTTLKHDSSSITGAGRGRLRGVLVGAQIAMCLVLTISASLLLRGLYAAQTVDPGFEYRDMAVVSFDLRGSGYGPEEATQFNRQLEERLAALPGVTAVAQAAETPLAPGRSGIELSLPGQGEPVDVLINNVSPDYFSALGIPVVRGRAFAAADLVDTSPSVIVTEATARRFWPGREPLGQTLSAQFGPDVRVTFEVIGVVRNAYLKSIGKIDDNFVYLPAVPRVQPELQTLVKTRADLATTMAGMREAARALDPALVPRVMRLEDNLDFWRTWSTLVAGVSGALGTLALVLASIGVYALVSYAVNLRMRELGIRVALGANARQVLALLLKQQGRPVITGAVIGVLACLSVARLLAGLLFGVSILDPVALGGATAFVLSVAFVAALLPGRRATRVDPMSTLRHE